MEYFLRPAFCWLFRPKHICVSQAFSDLFQVALSDYGGRARDPRGIKQRLVLLVLQHRSAHSTRN